MAALTSKQCLALIQAALHGDGKDTKAQYGSYQLQSVFQSIICVNQGKTIGYEGLLRAHDEHGAPISPQDVFKHTHSLNKTVFLDRLCRAMHLQNFAKLGLDDHWIFLNIDPQVIIQGSRFGAFFREFLAEVPFPAERVVIEVLERNVTNEEALAEAITYYRNMGCLIAVDDFGAGHSNFNRLWALMPDIVKLDRSLLVRALQQPNHRYLLSRIVALIHDTGAQALMEGVETEEEALTALDAGVDLVQGYLFDKPKPLMQITENDQADATGSAFAPFLNQFQGHTHVQLKQYRQSLQPYMDAFKTGITQIAQGQSIAAVSKQLFLMSNVSCCYLLDWQGSQLGDIFTNPKFCIPTRPAALKMFENNINWVRREYFQRAIVIPDQLHVTRPYVSRATARICVTLSQVIRCPAGEWVFCCDIDLDGPSAKVISSTELPTDPDGDYPATVYSA